MTGVGIQISSLGALLALVFVGAMSTLFYWMFHLPPVVPHRIVTVRRTVRALRRILVPVVETVPAERAVELACRIGEEQKAEIILAYVIEIPLTLPLNARMPDQEAAGRKALDTAEMLVQRHNLPVRSRMIPARHAADGILHLTQDEDADVIVMGVGVKRRAAPEQLGRTAEEVIRRAPCEVVLDKVPIQA